MNPIMPSREVLDCFRKGVVIPALPLALDRNRKLDERRQRALIRYYGAAGAGGIAVGVHTTQFEIRDAGVDLLPPLLELARDAIEEVSGKTRKPVVKIAGICGKTRQAIAEARLASSLGYDLGLLSLGAFQEATEDELIEHCKSVGREIALLGFYLQPAVGGTYLPYSFWRRFVEIENVVGIKIAPFSRYQTIDVVRAIASAGREREITLYTGNDDNIIIDLLTLYRFKTDDGEKTIRIHGGLLGQWSVWTRTAVILLEEIHRLVEAGDGIPFEMLTKNADLTDANAVLFDAANHFAGCIPGVHEVLRRQGLLEYSHCLNPALRLSPGQGKELDRVIQSYSWLPDDAFVQEHLDEWLQ